MSRSHEQGHEDGNDEIEENVTRKGPVTTGFFLIPVRETSMSRHNEMPPVPPSNRSHKGTGDNAEVSKDMAKTKVEVNTAEQGDTANIKQNTTNAGFFKGRRVK
jgi:hypothetical protein